jgi:predicted enzyme related to lactoylglutathione lyase
MNGHLYFEIHADDIRRAQEFYRKVFGWRFEKMDGLPVEYWRIETGGTRGGLLKRPTDTPPAGCGANAFVCSVEVEDFDEIGGKITRAGGRVALEKFAIPGTCWQGYFLDTEGNTFGLFEVDESAGK